METTCGVSATLCSARQERTLPRVKHVAAGHFLRRRRHCTLFDKSGPAYPSRQDPSFVSSLATGHSNTLVPPPTLAGLRVFHVRAQSVPTPVFVPLLGVLSSSHLHRVDTKEALIYIAMVVWRAAPGHETSPPGVRTESTPKPQEISAQQENGRRGAHDTHLAVVPWPC